ncbi:MAG: nucleotidyltransferase family protein [Bacteroidia bacterium]
MQTENPSHTNRLNEAIILAGGFGTRLKEVINDLPKPMAPVNGKPFLAHLLLYLKKYSIGKVILSTGYLSEKIEEYFGREYEEIQIVYSKEESPMGTGGGIKLAMGKCVSDVVLVMNGDSFFDIDINEFYARHRWNRADFSIALRKVENAARYGTIGLHEEDRILFFQEKNGEEKAGLINGGVYLLKRDLFQKNTPLGEAFSIERDFFETFINRFSFHGYISKGYFIDIGIPEDYSKAQDELKGPAY